MYWLKISAIQMTETSQKEVFFSPHEGINVERIEQTGLESKEIAVCDVRGTVSTKQRLLLSLIAYLGIPPN